MALKTWPRSCTLLAPGNPGCPGPPARLDPSRVRADRIRAGAPADDSDPAVVAAVEERLVLPVARDLSVRRLRELVQRQLDSLARKPPRTDAKSRPGTPLQARARRTWYTISALSMRICRTPDAVACRKTLDAHARAAQGVRGSPPYRHAPYMAGARPDAAALGRNTSPKTAHVTVVARSVRSPSVPFSTGALQRRLGLRPRSCGGAGGGRWMGRRRSRPPTFAKLLQQLVVTPPRWGCRRRPAACSTSRSTHVERTSSSPSPGAANWSASASGWPC